LVDEGEVPINFSASLLGSHLATNNQKNGSSSSLALVVDLEDPRSKWNWEQGDQMSL
jgi:hypothetical protein